MHLALKIKKRSTMGIKMDKKNKKLNKFLKSLLLMLVAGLIFIGCERSNTNSASNLARLSMLSQSGTGLNPYGTNPYGTQYGMNNQYANSMMMSQSMYGPMYQQYLEEARKDRQEKFSQDLLMTLAMKGTEMISMYFMTKNMGAMMPMMSMGSMNPAMMNPAMMGMMNPMMGSMMGGMGAMNPMMMNPMMGGMGAMNPMMNPMMMNTCMTCPACCAGMGGLTNTSQQLSNTGSKL